LTFKVVTLVGTRPEFIKLSRIIPTLDRHTQHLLVHSGQNYSFELDEAIFRDLEIRKPDHFLGVAAENAAQTIARVIESFDALLAREQPQAVLLLGDTNTCLGAIAAKRRRIPVFHIEAGNRCFDQRVPEEINRKIVDHVSDINMTYTEHARRYLLAEGLRPDMVIKIGSPMKEVLTYYRDRIDRSDVLNRLDLTPHQYFLVSAHREENVDSPDNLRDLLVTLGSLHERYRLPVLVSTHPRTQKRLRESMLKPAGEGIRFEKAFGFLDYVHLEMKARCVLSDSGTITEESSILGFPAVTLRNAHERPEGMDEGTLILCGVKPDRVLRAIEATLAQRDENVTLRIVGDYDADLVSAKVLRIILGYTDFVRQTVWRES